MAELLVQALIGADQVLALFAAVPRAALLLQIVAQLDDCRRQGHERFPVLTGEGNQLSMQLCGITSQPLIGAYQRWCQPLDHQADTLVQRVQALWQQRHRASRAIESFDAALRPYLYIHKGVTQGFLELFRAYFNLRTRRWGPRQGTCAYQQVTGQPLNDWLTLLGFPPTRAVH